MIDQTNLPGLGLNADHIVYSSYFHDHHIIQQTKQECPKNEIG